MAQTIGSVTCDILDIRVKASAPRINSWIRPGINGVGTRDMAKGPGSFIAVAEKLDTEGNINTWISSLQALQTGATITATDSHARTYTSLIVLSVDVAMKVAAIESSTKVFARVNLSGIVAP